MTIGTTTIANNGQVTFGFGALSELAGALGGLKIERAMICTDRGLRDAGLLDELLAEGGTE